MSPQQIQLLQSLSLLLLGAALSTLATLNFSLAFVIGVLASPLSFVRPLQRRVDHPISTLMLTAKLCVSVLTFMMSPLFVLLALSLYVGEQVDRILVEMAKGWVAQGAFTSLVVWCLWWPAWLLGNAVTLSGDAVARH